MTRQFQEWLEDKDACEESVEWIGERTAKAAWEECDDDGWMYWALSHATPSVLSPLAFGAVRRMLREIGRDDPTLLEEIAKLERGDRPDRGHLSVLSGDAGSALNYLVYAKTDTYRAASCTYNAVRAVRLANGRPAHCIMREFVEEFIPGGFRTLCEDLGVEYE